MVHAASEFTYELEERFISYARIDTQSDEKSTTSPGTEKQYELLSTAR
jgi:tripeptide aminopeptidase